MDFTAGSYHFLRNRQTLMPKNSRRMLFGLDGLFKQGNNRQKQVIFRFIARFEGVMALMC